MEGIAREERKRNRSVYLDLEQIETRWGSLEAFLLNSRIKAVIRSSSEQVLEPNVEHMASKAARKLGLPVFVVEDFPGNYWTRPGERLDGLFVEDDSVAELHKNRGVSAQLLRSTGNPRYDYLLTVDRQKRKVETRKALNLGDETSMLWVGQPDGDNSYLALERMLNQLGKFRFRLLFRAHPRDRAYATGQYNVLLGMTQVEVLDVSLYPDPIGLYCGSDLVVSQFSSACVESSYLGTPALFVLFDDLGKHYLRTLKGYETLPWCKENCAFLIEREEDVRDVVEEALFDRPSREEICTNFSCRFGNKMNSAEVIAKRIRELIVGGRDINE